MLQWDKGTTMMVRVDPEYMVQKSESPKVEGKYLNIFLCFSLSFVLLWHTHNI